VLQDVGEWSESNPSPGHTPHPSAEEVLRRGVQTCSGDGFKENPDRQLRLDGDASHHQISYDGPLPVSAHQQTSAVPPGRAGRDDRELSGVHEALLLLGVSGTSGTNPD